MQFSITAHVSSFKRGIALEDEYDRLAFPQSDSARPREFPTASIRILITAEFARKYRGFFEWATEVEFSLDTKYTDAEDWSEAEDGCMGLDVRRFTAERVIGAHQKQYPDRRRLLALRAFLRPISAFLPK